MLTAEKAYERRWWTLGVLCTSLLVISVDNSILNVALPTIVRDLGATGSDLQWIVDAYVIVFACLLLTAGALGDKFGRKRALTFGLVWFGTFSAVATTANSPTMLITCRALMGVGAAFIFPTTLSILTNTFTGHERAKAIGVWAGVSGLGVAVGPMLGGLLIEHFSWAAVFLVNVPLCAAALVLGYFFIPDSRDPDNRPLDPIGALLSIFTLVALLYAIIQAPQVGWLHQEVVASFLAGLVLLAAFALWELRNPEPMLDLHVFKNPRFSAASAVVTLISFALYGSIFLLIQYFQFVLGYSPLEAGALAMPVAICMMITSPNAPKLVLRWGTKRVVMLGLAVVILGMCLYASDTIMSSILGGAFVRGLFGIGLGLTSAPATESIMGSLPPARAGVGSAINDTTRQTGGALGVAVIGSVFLSWYHHFVRIPAGVTGQGAAALRDSVGTALEYAARAPGKQADLIVEHAKTAFVEAMRLTYPISACFLLAAFFIAWKWLPARAHAHADADHDVHDARDPHHDIDLRDASVPQPDAADVAGA
jgi:EmrB/QacA subfamily drug resistance transporter